MSLSSRSSYTARRYRYYVVNRKRLTLFLITAALFIIFLVLLILNLISSHKGQYTVDQFVSGDLLMYFELEKEMDVPWYYLAAIDLAEDIPETEISRERSAGIALHLTGMKNPEDLSDFLSSYNNSKSFHRKVEREVKALSHIRLIAEDKIFPFATNAEYTYEDGYGDPRSYGGRRSHEGIDIMTDHGVPILSVCDGEIEKSGWNELGGWRLGIRGAKDNIYYYYAHLSRYEGDPKPGDKVKKGLLIGYVGDSGYGQEGTTGEFLPHLHFGMYYGKEGKLRPFNPYPFLMAWER